MAQHRTFKGNLHDMALERRAERQAAARAAITCLKLASKDLPNRVKANISEIEDDIELFYSGSLNPAWENMVGLHVETDVDRVNSDSYGDYTLDVIKTQRHPHFKCLVTGPQGVAEWWPGCGRSETETMVSVGCWRHTIRRFFGLEAKGSS
jgi:hypothetical protein